MNRALALVCAVATSSALADTVTLVDGGPSKLQCIKVLREATGLGLAETKRLVEAAPVVVKDRLSAAEAKALAKKLTDVGATVKVEAGPVAAPTTVGTSKEGSWDVRLEAFGASKLQCIKVVREATGLGLAETKALVEAAPVTVKRGQSRDAAEALVKQLQGVGATARAELMKD